MKRNKELTDNADALHMVVNHVKYSRFFFYFMKNYDTLLEMNRQCYEEYFWKETLAQ
jgi:hypothetical protein